MEKKKVIILTGPTASGKTSMAIQLARHFNTSIISADSRQCYRELNIGVAKPTHEQLALVRHYFIDTHSIHDEVNAASFARYTSNVLDEIFLHSDTAIVAGGTGLYIKAFLEGLDEVPEVSAEIRESVRKNYQANGISWLQDEVKKLDPLYYGSGEIQNPQRLMWALEVKMGTGQSIKEFQTRNVSPPGEYAVSKYAIDISRERLYSNINERVDEMMLQGLEAEARSLFPYRHLNALQTVGYTELFDFFEGTSTLQHAIDKIKQHTRNYAKRQLTWFRKDAQMVWISSLQEILSREG